MVALVTRMDSQDKKGFPRQKWNEVKIGDAVLVLMPDSPRAHWPLTRFLEICKEKLESFAQLKF